MDENPSKLKPNKYSYNAWLTLAFILLGYLIQINLQVQKSPVVDIGTGKVQGRVGYSREGREFLEFLGVPYAKPPVDELRFQSPEAPERWEGIRPAYSLGPECFGAELLTTGRVVGQEDCLYLNVHTPARFNGSSELHRELLPVLVYIHGGGFFMGSTHLYGATYIMDQDVVLVTMNYRLGAFGFLNTGDRSARGNMGLKDQNIALKWVQKNIIQFGGDPSRITLAGESAGAQSVHAHMMSPMSKGLFHRAISISGTVANTEWALNRNHTITAFELGKKVGCNQVISSELVRCLKTVPGRAIMATYLDNMSPLQDVKHLLTPSIETIKDSRTFLSEDPMHLMETGNFYSVPWMMGLMEHEGLVYVLRMIQNGISPLLLKDPQFRNEHLGRLLYHDTGSSDLWDKISDFYFPNMTASSGLSDIDDDEFISSLSHLFSDRFFTTGAHNSALYHSQHSPVYLFQMTYKSQFNVFNVLRGASPWSWIPFELQMAYHLTLDFISNLLGMGSKIYGASHGDDVTLAFYATFATDVRKHSKDYKFSRDFVKLMTDFSTKDLEHLKYNGVKWQPVDRNSTTLKFLNLGVKARMLPDPYSNRMKFFKSLEMT